MPFTVSEAAELAVVLKLVDKLSGPAKIAEGSLRGLDKTASQVDRGFYKIGAGIGTGLRNAAILGAAGVGFLAVNVAKGYESLSKLEQISTQTNTVLKSTGGVAGQTAASVRNLAEKYETLNATIDDKVIQSAENLLLTFPSVRKEAFEPTLKAVLDMNTALGGGEAGLQQVVIQVGKAMQDPIRGLTTLRRVGVNFTADQQKQIKALVDTNQTYKAQQIILGELDREFGGSFLGQGGTTAAKIAKVRDAIEEIQMHLATAMLPAVSALATGLDRLFSDPAVIAGADELGRAIAGIFSTKNIDAAVQFAKDTLPTIRDGLKLTLGVAKGALDLFNSLPAELKTVAIAALVGNKLTGGLVASGIGDVAKGLLASKGGLGGLLGRGQSPASPLYVQQVGLPAGGPTTGGGVAGAGKGFNLLGMAKLLGSFAILTVALDKLGEEFGKFQMKVGAAQADLGAKVAATSGQDARQTIDNLESVAKTFQSLGPLDQLIASTFGGAEIQKDLVSAAQRLVDVQDLTKEQLQRARAAIDAARNLPSVLINPDTNVALEKAIRDIDLRLAGGKVGQGFLDGAAAAIKGLLPKVLQSVPPHGTDQLAGKLADDLQQSFTTALAKVKPYVPGDWTRRLFASGAEAIGAFADGLHSARQQPVDELNSLAQMLKHPLTRMAEATRLAGQLASKTLAEALRSHDPEIVARAQILKEHILDRLRDLQRQGAPIGSKAMELLRQGMASKDSDIAAQARAIYEHAKHPLDGLGPAGAKAGKAGGENYAKGIRSAGADVSESAGALARLGTAPLVSAAAQAYAAGHHLSAQFAAGISTARTAVEKAVHGIAAAIPAFLWTNSPAKMGPLALYGGPEGMGQRLAELYAEGLARAGREVIAASAKLGDAAARGLKVKPPAITAPTVDPGRATPRLTTLPVVTIRPSVTIPRALPPVVNMRPVVNVPRALPLPAPVVRIAPPSVTLRPSFNVPRALPPSVSVRPIVNVPRIPAPSVTVPAPTVHITVPRTVPPTVLLRPSFLVPRPPPPSVVLRPSITAPVAPAPRVSITIPRLSSPSVTLRPSFTVPRAVPPAPRVSVNVPRAAPPMVSLRPSITLPRITIPQAPSIHLTVPRAMPVTGRPLITVPRPTVNLRPSFTVPRAVIPAITLRPSLSLPRLMVPHLPTPTIGRHMEPRHYRRERIEHRPLPVHRPVTHPMNLNLTLRSEVSTRQNQIATRRQMRLGYVVAPNTS